MNDLTWGDQDHGPLGHGFQYYYGLPFTLVDEFVSEVGSADMLTGSFIISVS